MKKNIFIISEGAIGIDLKPYGLGFMILRKKDGNTLYGTKDLVLAGKKFDEFNIDRSIYIVASEQNHHFKQVFKTLELMGFEQAKSCYHLSYGMVVLPDGKMSSRAGNTIAFGTLRKQLEQIFAEQLKKYETEWPAEEIHAAIEKLSIATMRFGMLSSDANKDVVFNLDDWTSFEGCSGPYLLYSYARAQSILRKVSDEYKLNDFTLFKAADIADDISFDLLRSINDLAYTIYNSTEHYRVSSIAQTLYSMAKSFNRFYRELKILKAESDDLRQSRATLVYTFSKIFAEGLKLLGIEPLDRM